jgi:hypothetical protein
MVAASPASHPRPGHLGRHPSRDHAGFLEIISESTMRAAEQAREILHTTTDATATAAGTAEKFGR